MDKANLSERDICSKYITPALVEQAGWDLNSQIREEVTFTAGQVLVRGNIITRGQKKRADYILYYKPNIPIAVIEVKDNSHSVGSGMQQALCYAELLDIPFVYSTNGDGFLEHDLTVTLGVKERPIALDQFPSPEALWQRYLNWKGLNQQQQLISQDYYTDGSGKKPRYYQLIAINRTVEAIAQGQKRLLLVMATGVGKTFTAFQIIWRLWKAGKMKRILFLADRNILIDQTKTNDFKPFGRAMVKITNRQVDKSYQIYLCLYQGISGHEEAKNIYRQFSPDFFDLVVVDECHRGSAAEDSPWRNILEYFHSATQIGLTATPKETKEVSNIDYFGEPIFTYSLKQGIEDGFLAPYTVIRVDLDSDLYGWEPSPGKRDKYGYEIEGRLYDQNDFDRFLVLEERTKLVAKKVTEFLKKTDRFSKTILFCEDIDHAERMRQALVNENADLVAENRKYVMRITGDDKEGKEELDNFILPDSKYPVIVTTSELLTTGVDAQTCKLIVLDKRIQSMAKFKQIIGRGTRINEDYNKYCFTIIDFKKATELFSDPSFDGEAEKIYEVMAKDLITPPEAANKSPNMIDTTNDRLQEGRKKYYVDDVEVSLIAERVQYLGKDGKLITESLRNYTLKNLHQEFASLTDFLKRWDEAEKKQIIIEELEAKGVLLSALAEEIGKDLDPFDLICHLAFDRPPLTRQERANQLRKQDYFSKYQAQARAVLEALLDKYAIQGVEVIESLEALKIPPLNQVGTPLEILKYFGGKSKYLSALKDLQSELYKVS